MSACTYEDTGMGSAAERVNCLGLLSIDITPWVRGRGAIRSCVWG